MTATLSGSFACRVLGLSRAGGGGGGGGFPGGAGGGPSAGSGLWGGPGVPHPSPPEEGARGEGLKRGRRGGGEGVAGESRRAGLGG